jgi:hypothetical protein
MNAAIHSGRGIAEIAGGTPAKQNWSTLICPLLPLRMLQKDCYPSALFQGRRTIPHLIRIHQRDIVRDKADRFVLNLGRNRFARDSRFLHGVFDFLRTFGDYRFASRTKISAEFLLWLCPARGYSETGFIPYPQ